MLIITRNAYWFLELRIVTLLNDLHGMSAGFGDESNTTSYLSDHGLSLVMCVVLFICSSTLDYLSHNVCRPGSVTQNLTI